MDVSVVQRAGPLAVFVLGLDLCACAGSEFTSAEPEEAGSESSTSGGQGGTSSVAQMTTTATTATSGAGGASAGGGGSAGAGDPTTYYLSDLPWVLGTNNWGPVEKDMSNGEFLVRDGHRLTIGGTTYAKGLGVNASSVLVYRLSGGCTTFATDVGIDSEAGPGGTVTFRVLADGKPVQTSAKRTGQPASHIDVDIGGVQRLVLYADDEGDIMEDHGDWADARVACPSGIPMADAGRQADAGQPDASTGAVTPYDLGDTDWVLATNESGPVERNTSNGEKAAGDGKPITIGGVTYQKGLGVSATSFIVYKLNGVCSTFTAEVGIDAEAPMSAGSIRFRVLVDGDPAFVSQAKRVGQPAEHVSVDVTGAAMLALYADDDGDNYKLHADWADARIFCSSPP
jgi:alpha-galactosidase